jgi:aspartate aminotransferase
MEGNSMPFGLSNRVKEIAPSPTLAIDTKTKQMIAEGVDVINLSVGEPDFNTPKPACDAAVEAIYGGFTKYTAVPGIVELRKAIAEKLERENGVTYSPDEIIVSSGGKHSLYNIFVAIINPGDEVIVPAPYWVSYPEMIRLVGGVPVIVETDESTGFKVTPEMLSAAITEKTKALVLNTPSNPTGAVYSPDEIRALAKVIEQHEFYVISDEIYEKLLYDAEHLSSAAVSEGMKKRTLLVNGFSKAFSMTGWRMGYVAGDRAIIKAMTSFQSQTTSNPVSISQKAAIAALNSFDPEMVTEFRRRRDFVLRRLEEMPLIRCIEPQGAFYAFPNIADILGKSYNGQTIDSSDTLAELLLTESKIALVPGSGFGAPNNIRISYATSMANLEKAMDRLESFLKNVR